MSVSSEDFDFGNPEVFYRDFYGKMICGCGNGGGGRGGLVLGAKPGEFGE